MDLLAPIKKVGHLLYPRVCAVCSNWLVHGESGLCLHCLDELPRTQFGYSKSNAVERLFWARVPLDYATAFLHFSEKSMVREILHRIKYSGASELAVEMGKLFASELLSKDPAYRPDFLIPVPSHPSKQRQRGFNQAEEIARGMSEVFNTEVGTHFLQRRVHHDSQTKKARFDRWQNVNSIFTAQQKERLEGLKVMVVDDVITTGATLEACCNLLTDVREIKLGIAGLAAARR